MRRGVKITRNFEVLISVKFSKIKKVKKRMGCLKVFCKKRVWRGDRGVLRWYLKPDIFFDE